jgi:excisionase family DNA binding protein
VTESPGTTIEEIANTISAAVARATKAVREVSDAIAELREAEIMLKGLAASPTIATEKRKSSNEENPRLAYRVNEAAKLLGVHRRTIEKKIKVGVLVSSKRLGTRLISVESIKALFEPSD